MKGELNTYFEELHPEIYTASEGNIEVSPVMSHSRRCKRLKIDPLMTSDPQSLFCDHETHHSSPSRQTTEREDSISTPVTTLISSPTQRRSFFPGVSYMFLSALGGCSCPPLTASVLTWSSLVSLVMLTKGKFCLSFPLTESVLRCSYVWTGFCCTFSIASPSLLQMSVLYGTYSSHLMGDFVIFNF